MTGEQFIAAAISSTLLTMARNDPAFSVLLGEVGVIE
jgi:hypothetical protein